MRKGLWCVVLVVPLLVAGALRAAELEQLAWAYAVPPPPPAPPAGAPAAAPAAPADDGKLLSLPDTDKTFTRTQIRNQYGPADWYPNDHPPMPDIVAKGRQAQTVRACALCHYPNGKGRPENSSVSGLPVSYFIQQMLDYKNGSRKSAETRKNNTNLMADIAKAMTDEEIKATAEYFGAIKFTSWIRVVEATTVPKMRSQAGLWVKVTGAGAGTEPLGQRIIETPEDEEQSEMYRNPRSGYVAYVPVGAVKKGETLAKTGGSGRTVACGVCHGPELTGLGPVPAIAGRSASLMARQLFDLQQGARKGAWSDLMKEAVAKLTAEEILNLSAYVASLPPQGGQVTRTAQR
ncbi:MAG: cytochrome c [Vicinamibacterales bacterium]